MKTIYKLSEFADLLEMSKRRTKRFLIAASCPLHRHANTDYLYLSDLQTYLPDLFASLSEQENIQETKSFQINPNPTPNIREQKCPPKSDPQR